jgi:hypothetical protein
VASTITLFSNKIDINYPVVGQDNDTQGFRDNFSAIQSAFAVASAELSNLQDNGVKLTETNDFNYNILKNAVLQNTSELVKSRTVSTVSTSYAYVSIDYSEGSYHKCNLTLSASNTNTYAFSIVNWPSSGNYGRLFLELSPSSTSTTTVSILGNTKIIGYNTGSVTYFTTSSIFYELWTTDNGSKIFGTISS